MEEEWEGRGVDKESPACGVAVSAWKLRSALRFSLRYQHTEGVPAPRLYQPVKPVILGGNDVLTQL